MVHIFRNFTWYGVASECIKLLIYSIVSHICALFAVVLITTKLH
jgi:hypothetical protein